MVYKLSNPTPFYYLRLQKHSIFEQLQLEEMLLRNDPRNIFILSEGSTIPSIVLGISNAPERHVHLQKASAMNIPLIRRFSGGGTVVVDEGTIFVTIIAHKSLLQGLSLAPEPILHFAKSLFAPTFTTESVFTLKENDFTLGDKKCGGNALYLKKERFLLHTSFLWTYLPERLSLLKHPPKMPSYRHGRPHEEFVCSIKEHFPSKEVWLTSLEKQMKTLFLLEPIELRELKEQMATSDHRRSTSLEY